MLTQVISGLFLLSTVLGETTSDIEIIGPDNYGFSYNVDEGLNNFGHKESRNGDKTKGEYRTLLPDGRIQVVTYIADENGYEAEVNYISSKEAKSIPLTNDFRSEANEKELSNRKSIPSPSASPLFFKRPIKHSNLPPNPTKPHFKPQFTSVPPRNSHIKPNSNTFNTQSIPTFPPNSPTNGIQENEKSSEIPFIIPPSPFGSQTQGFTRPTFRESSPFQPFSSRPTRPSPSQSSPFQPSSSRPTKPSFRQTSSLQPSSPRPTKPSFRQSSPFQPSFRTTRPSFRESTPFQPSPVPFKVSPQPIRNFSPDTENYFFDDDGTTKFSTDPYESGENSFYKPIYLVTRNPYNIHNPYGVESPSLTELVHNHVSNTYPTQSSIRIPKYPSEFDNFELDDLEHKQISLSSVLHKFYEPTPNPFFRSQQNSQRLSSLFLDKRILQIESNEESSEEDR